MAPLASSGTGRLWVFHSGQWGTICADSWDLCYNNLTIADVSYAPLEGLL